MKKLLSARDLFQPTRLTIYKNGRLAFHPKAVINFKLKPENRFLLFTDDKDDPNSCIYYMQITTAENEDAYKLIPSKDGSYLFGDTRARFERDKVPFVSKSVTFYVTEEDDGDTTYYRMEPMPDESIGNENEIE